MDKKYQLNYTLNRTHEQAGPVFDREFFSTKKAANEYLKKNKDKIFWSQLVETNAKSAGPKPLLNFEPQDGYIKKSGTLQTYFETGMECTGLIFYEDGIHGGPNPNFDPSKPEGGDNFKYWASYEAIHYIRHGDILDIPGVGVVGMIKDRDFAVRDGFRLSFYPQGFSREELINLFWPENVKVTIWIKEKK